MASSSLRSMYKTKFREENTISSRRMSRGLERKKNREDEVNKRRLLSDDMSPVIEDSSHQDKDEAGKIVHEKASTRLERLKQWRQEKKRKAEKEKKESKKPLFKMSPLKYIGESNLYKRTEQVKPVKNSVKNDPTKLYAASKTNAASLPSKEAVKPVSVGRPVKIKPVSDQAIIHKSASNGGSVAARPNRITQSAKSQAVKETSVRSGQRAVASKPSTSSKPPVTQVTTQQKGKITDLSTKLTASTAAKTKGNLDKPREFLRAKSRVTRQTVQNKKPDHAQKQDSAGHRKEEIQQAVHADAMTEVRNKLHVVINSEPDPSESSSNSKEFHLSDSAVSSPKHSTPAPRRSARVKKGSEKISKLDTENARTGCSQGLQIGLTTPHRSSRNLSAITAIDEGSEKERNSGVPVVEEEKMFECSLLSEAAEEKKAACTQDNSIVQEEIVREASAADEINTSRQRSRKSRIIQGKRQHSLQEDSRSTSVGDTEEEIRNQLEMSNKENIVYEEMKMREKILRKSASKLNLNVAKGVKLRKSQRLSVVNNPELCREELTVDLQTTRHSQHLVSSANGAPSTAKRHRRLVDKTKSCVEAELCHTKEQTDDTDTQLPVFDNSTPKSHQQAEVGSALAKRKSVRIAALVSFSDSDTNFQNEMAGTAKYRKTPGPSRRRSTRTRSLANPISTFVSVSDEGTSDVIGESVDDEMTVQVSPKHLTLLGNSVNQRRSNHRSEVIDVSDEGTDLSNDHNHGMIYQIAKPVESEPSSRALQELEVHKVEGEISFIEVPIDESLDINVHAQTVSSVKHLTSAASNDQVLVEEHISSATTVTEEDNQSTQPFTPRRSSDLSKMTVSSTQSSATSGTQVAQNVTTSATPRSSRSRGISMNDFPSFKTPGQPASALRTRSQRKRRKTEQSVLLKSPEEMIEILKKSPMIELTRRRSRHVSSPAVMSPTNLDILLAACTNLQEPDLLLTNSTDTERTSLNVSSCNTELSAASLSQSQPTEPVSLNFNATDGVKYFHDILLSETNRLNQLCNKWTDISSCSPSLQEEALGQIRSTVGKAQLLMGQRFKQFSGLVDNCEFNRGEKETTLTDLQGFWEMIYFQVEDVNRLFAQLTELQQNNWDVKQPSPTKDMPKRKAAKIYKPKIKSNFASFREELMRRKAATVKLSTTASTAENSETAKVFDAGFFKVTSPVRSPSGKKSQVNSPLMPIISDIEQSSGNRQDNSTHVVEKLTNCNKEQLSTPVNHGNKENKVASAVSSRLSSMSVKRLSYLPAVPSPLLNDITGLIHKKS